MTTLSSKTMRTVLVVSGSIAMAALVGGTSRAAQPEALLVAPAPEHCLPEFGFSSFNIRGVGERVTHVRWGGRASRLGLEPGDLILSMNGLRLNYHGAWDDALHRAVHSGGWVELTIRDVRTGRLAHRHTHVGDEGIVVGPITPKAHLGGFHPPVPRRHVSRPVGPITPKAKSDDRRADVRLTIKDLTKLFD